jgi:similar to spore coat protein
VKERGVIHETASPEVREVLRRQLKVAIVNQGKIAKYIVNKGYDHVYNPQEQIRTDINITDAVMTLP